MQIHGNLAGVFSILLWSCSALFFSYAESMPTFLLLSTTFFFGGIIFVMIWGVRSPQNLAKNLRPPLMSVLFPLIGIGLYNVLYYNAFKYAPIEEANIINYMWPTFIILFSCFLPEHRLKLHVIFGALICFLGICVLRIGGELNVSAWTFELGHFLAFLAALTWGIYSVLIKKSQHNSPSAVPVSFLYNAAFFLCLHFLFEERWLIDWSVLPAAIVLGCMVGVGYFMWDIAMSRGDIQMLGVLSYLTPISSIFLLVTFGYPVMTSNLFFAACFIVVGTLIASKDRVIEVYQRYKNK